MDNYSKIKSIFLQLEILGDGKYDHEIRVIEGKLSNNPYTATNNDLNYASSILAEVMEKCTKKQLAKLNKYDLSKVKLVGDIADEFINENKRSVIVTPSAPTLPSAPIPQLRDNPEDFKGLL